MCFFQQPQLPAMQPAPSTNSEETRRRRAQQNAANTQQQGRAATILTSPLGDPTFGQAVNRTTLVAV